MIKTKNILYVTGCLVCAGIGVYIGKRWIAKQQDIAKEKLEGDTEVETVTGNEIIPFEPEEEEIKVPGTDHFNIEEYNSKDGVPVPVQFYGNIQRLMEQMEIARANAFGGRPIHINSGWRSPAHNAAVGGVSNSQHPKGNANDFTVQGFTPKQVYDKMQELIVEGKILPGGLGLYPTFVHYDTRGTNARWSG